MKQRILVLLLISGMHLTLYAEVIPEYPIVKKPIDPKSAIRGKKVIRPTVLYGKHYHTYVTTTESNCDQYIETIKEKDKKIEALLKENLRLKKEAQTDLQNRLKEEYDRELQKFEDRRK